MAAAAWLVEGEAANGGKPESELSFMVMGMPITSVTSPVLRCTSISFYFNELELSLDGTSIYCYRSFLSQDT